MTFNQCPTMLIIVMGPRIRIRTGLNHGLPLRLRLRNEKKNFSCHNLIIHVTISTGIIAIFATFL